MEDIQVLHIGKYYPPYIGGTESHLSTLVDELKKEVKIDVLCANTKFRTAIEKCDGISIYRLACLGSLFSVPLTLSLPIWLKKRKADILHFHLPNPLAILSYFLSKPKGRIIVSYHSDIVRQRFFSPLFNPFLIRFLKKAEAIIVTSDNLIKNSPMLRRFKNRCKIIPHGIDINQFQANEGIVNKAEEIRQRYKTPLILFVGRLVYYKGLEYLLKAMQGIKARLLIIGNGPLQNRLKRLSNHYGISDKIIWLGEMENERIIPFYYACDVFVLPSSMKAESFGIVQLEAFACGKPVVSTDLPTGVPLVNLNENTGLIVPPCNSFVLAYALNRLLVSAKLQKIYGENAKERVQREFTKERMVKEVLEVYRKVL